MRSSKLWLLKAYSTSILIILKVQTLLFWAILQPSAARWGWLWHPLWRIMLRCYFWVAKLNLSCSRGTLKF